MGHKKKDGRNSRTLHQQAYDKLQKMQAFGDSKRLDKLENPEDFAAADNAAATCYPL